jgi:hypothetical protein
MVDVHAHFTTDGYIDRARAAGHSEPDGMPESYWPQWSTSRHLELMDQAGIARAMLSPSSPGVHFGNAAAARSLAREINETSADIVREHPQRFGHFVSLPLPDIAGSLPLAAPRAPLLQCGQRRFRRGRETRVEGDEHGHHAAGTPGLAARAPALGAEL